MEIKKQGYYVSDSVHWADHHAGIKTEGAFYYILIFENDKCFCGSLENIDKIDIQQIVSSAAYRLYKIASNTLEIQVNPHTEFEFTQLFRIMSPDVLLDENLREYRYVGSSGK
jgi:hypothetical protein